MSGGRQLGSGSHVSPVRNPSAYDVFIYIRDFSPYFDTQWLSVLLTSDSALTVPIGPRNSDTAVGAWRKRWKHRSGRRACTPKAACHRMDFPFVQSREEDWYQQRLAALSADVRRRSALPRLVATELLYLAYGLGHLYFAINCPYWVKDFHFDVLVRDHQGLFTGWQDIEIFNMRVSDRAQYYSRVPSWWAQYEVHILLFVPTPLILAYYSRLVLQGSADY